MPIKKIFFSHASEDKLTVLAVRRELIARYPELDPWIDTFEIVGGESLIEKIAEGMDNAEKFFVFLSPVSITKPWVRKELNRALSQEISGQKPNFVVPVLLGAIDQRPPFSEEKRYIDLHRQTVAEWTGEIKAAIDGKWDLIPTEPTENLLAEWHSTTARPNVGAVTFSVASWAEDLSFGLRTAAPVLAHDHVWIEGGFRGGFTAHHAAYTTDVGYHYIVYALANTRLSPGDKFQLRLRFHKGVKFVDSITEVGRWDGAGFSNTTISMGTVFTNPDLARLGPLVDDPDEDLPPA